MWAGARAPHQGGSGQAPAAAAAALEPRGMREGPPQGRCCGGAVSPRGHPGGSPLWRGSGELRLVGGGGRCAGRVEVKHGGEWGSVCAFDFDWEARWAVVVCRQLGCGRVARASLHAPFGPGSGRIWLQPFFCNGTEDALERCPNFGWGRHFCGHERDVGVTCTDAVELRLAGGGSPCAGRVEVKLQGHWGTVADNNWDMEDAEVVCQQLGCGSAFAAYYTHERFGIRDGFVSLALVDCRGDEATLWDCEIRGWGPYNSSINVSDVAVVCQGFSRLVGGDGSCAGRLEVRQGRAWVGVCEDQVDMKVAQVVCRELGCGEVIAIAGSGCLGAVSGSLWDGGFQCNGTEPRLSACARRPAKSPGCSGPGSVICSSYTGFRLGNGSSGCSGRVEVAVRGTWGSVCASEWDLADAHVLCRHVGCGRALSVLPGGSFGSGEGPLRPDAFGCSGSERHPGQCPVAVLGKPPCAPGNAAAVNCSGAVESLRLVKGETRCEGFLESKTSTGSWRRVPGEVLLIRNLSNVCWKMGCGGLEKSEVFLGTSYLAQISYEDWEILKTVIEDIKQMTTDLPSRTVRDDYYSDMTTSTADGRHGACLVCSGSLRVRLVGSSGRCAGRVEVYSGGSWSWVCQEGWELQDAAVVCRELGCGTALQAPGWARLGGGPGPLWPYSPECSGSEESLWECGRTERRECGRGGGAGAVCSEQLSVRLAGGPGRCRGFLEMFHNNTWGRVCANGTSNGTAATVCHQLGCGRSVSLTAVSAQEPTEAWLAWVGCEDGARSLWQCSSAPWHLQSCGSPGGHAYVECEEHSDGTTEGHTTPYPEGATSTGVPRRRPRAVAVGSVSVPTVLCVVLGTLLCLSLGALALLLCRARARRRGPGRAADAISNAVYEELDYKAMPEYQEVPTPPGSLLEGWVKKLPYDTGDSVAGSDTEAAPDPPARPEQGPPDGYDDVLDVAQEPPAGSTGDISEGVARQRWICVLPTGGIYSPPGPPGATREPSEEPPGHMDYDDVGTSTLGTLQHPAVAGQPGHGPGLRQVVLQEVPDVQAGLQGPEGVQFLQQGLAESVRAQPGRGGGRSRGEGVGACGEGGAAAAAVPVRPWLSRGLRCPARACRAWKGPGQGPDSPQAPQRAGGMPELLAELQDALGSQLVVAQVQAAETGPSSSCAARAGQEAPASRQLPSLVSPGRFLPCAAGGLRGPEGGGCAALSAAAQVSGGACGRWRGREPPGGDRLLPALGRGERGAAAAAAAPCGSAAARDRAAGSPAESRGLLDVGWSPCSPSGGLWAGSSSSSSSAGAPGDAGGAAAGQVLWGGCLPPGTSGWQPTVARCVTAEAQARLIFGHGAGYWRPRPRSREMRRLIKAAAPGAAAAACIGSGAGRGALAALALGPLAMGPLLALGLLVCVRLCGGSGELRLVGGGGRCAGRVEVKHGGEWGSVCAFDFDWEARWAVVVCRQLGCGRVARASLHAPFGPGSGRIWLQPFFCNGTEDALERCPNFGWGRHFCGHERDVGVTCTDAVELRLAGGGSPCAGRVEVKLQGHWGTVGDDSWDMEDAEVVCQQLDCGSASAAYYTHESFGVGDGFVSLALVDCRGDEATLWDCMIRGWGPYNSSIHGLDAAVVCQGFSRLVGGDGSCAGRLEVRQGRAWVGVCEDQVDMKVAQVVCRELGCGEVIAIAGSGRFGAVSGSLWDGGFQCNGTEPRLSACARRPAHSQGCSGPGSVICSSYTGFRLGNGSSGCSGRVEVAVRGTWGSVCASEWDLADAHVLCRHVGCGRALSVLPGGSFGSGEGPLRPDTFGCSGSERHPGQCPVAVLGKPPCAPGNAAAVKCSGVGFVTSLRLVDGQSFCDGRLEESITSPDWRRVPLEQWKLWDVYMVCAVLGCGLPKDVYTALGTAPVLSSSRSEVDIITEEMDSIFGMGSALTSSPEEMDNQLEEMGDVSGMGPAANSSLEEMIIVCSGGCPEKSWRCRGPRQPPQPTPSVPTGSLRVRLVGSSGRCAGRVEVYSGGSWSWVCQEGWELQDAAVVCRELGCGTALQAPGWARLGGGPGPLWPYSPECSGSEESLWECGRTERRECGRGGGAGAVCSEQLSVQLAGGPGRCRGFLEVSYNGTWGRVCANGTSPGTAATVCHQLGCGHRGWLTAVSAQEPTEAWLAWVGCEDGARSLWQCSSAPWHLQSCGSPGGHAYVECEEHSDGTTEGHTTPYPEGATSTGVPRRRPRAVAVGSVSVPTVLCVVLGTLLCLSLGALALLLCRARARRRGPGRAADAISNAVYEELDYKAMPEYQEVPTPPGSLLEGWVKKLPYDTGDSVAGSDTEAAPDPPARPEQRPPDGYDDVLDVAQEPPAGITGDISEGMARQRWICVLPTGGIYSPPGPPGATREPSEQPPGHMDYDDVGSSALGTLP
ncbi:antigen WC1.1-like [Melospiza georgiana]|uniref:antigen WC1.1-like n=1 Tax=Melospiza georgiana TaxID=44398 RepID=UPI0025ABE393|nr:antigen WC1.1-like [Melospiza georgiana]